VVGDEQVVVYDFAGVMANVYAKPGQEQQGTP
jgi:hypothetical protein